jgi:hypothetical protein
MTCTLKPFHESIVEAIEACENLAALDTLGQLILITKIPENHDAIMAAWAHVSTELGFINDLVFLSIAAQASSHNE